MYPTLFKEEKVHLITTITKSICISFQVKQESTQSLQLHLQLEENTINIVLTSFSSLFEKKKKSNLYIQYWLYFLLAANEVEATESNINIHFGLFLKKYTENPNEDYEN